MAPQGAVLSARGEAQQVSQQRALRSFFALQQLHCRRQVVTQEQPRARSRLVDGFGPGEQVGAAAAGGELFELATQLVDLAWLEQRLDGFAQRAHATLD